MAKITRKSKPGVERNKTELIWDGKKTEVEKISLPFQAVETVNESRADREEFPLFAGQKKETPAWRNKLIWGDNKYIMSSLLEDFTGRINLIYIDPPFATGADFSINMKVGDVEWTKEASVIEEKAYRDTWGKGLDSYLQMMYDRLVLMRGLLTDNGSIYLHLDWHVGHYVKIMMDEIFGKENLVNEIIWSYDWGGRGENEFAQKHDTLLFYAKNKGKHFFNGYAVAIPYKTQIEGRRKPLVTKEKFERGKIPTDVWDITIVHAVGVERLDFPTQKPEALLERIIKASSNKGDLVADFFCGSGTTGAVAEKLGRRWIMSDLSKFAIHTTRKRLLDIANCKPFEILNLGNYQKQKFIENNYPPIKKYVEFMLKLYRAEEISGYNFIHGKKAGKLVHISNVDSMVTEAEIRDVLKEIKESGAKAIDILGWDFEMGLSGLIDKIGDEYGAKVRLVQIPKETLEVKSPTKEEIKFFDLNYLEVVHKVNNKRLEIDLKDFVIANPEYIPEDVKEKIKKFTDYIDYWAVDFDYRDDTFHNTWQSFRTKKHPKLDTKCSFNYEKTGKHKTLIKVIDIFGNDTNKLIDM